MIKSVYIHIPFCEKICSYCDFCKVLYNEELVDKYLEALERDILGNYKGEEIRTLYIGGGTPSALSVCQLEKLFKICSVFKCNELEEFTIEANFENTTHEKLELFKKAGVNRLSFGLESTKSHLLKFLNRDFDREHIIDIVKYAKEIGFKNINIDLIYALENESLKDLEGDLDFVTSLDVEHISTYSLIIEEHTLLHVLKKENINEDMDFAMYKFICKYLKDRGFKHYEISNFAREGYYSKHNSVYWCNLEYYGFGLGASSYMGNYRINNTRSFEKYFKGERVLEKEEVSLKDKQEYEVLLGLRLSYGIDKKKFLKTYGKKIEECYNYSGLIKNGFIMEDQDRVYIPEDKFYISNEIIVNFIEGVKDGEE